MRSYWKMALGVGAVLLVTLICVKLFQRQIGKPGQPAGWTGHQQFKKTVLFHGDSSPRLSAAAARASITCPPSAAFQTSTNE